MKRAKALDLALERGRTLRNLSPGSTTRPGGDASPRVGDLWILPALGDVPELWLVLEVALPGRIRLIPVDLDPRKGSGDVAVSPESRCGALTLRGRHATWAHPEQLLAGQIAGRLEPEHLAKIASRVAALDAGKDVGNLPERATDADPEYQDLDAELRRVCARLAPASVPSTGTASPLGPSRSKPWTLLVAATLALVVGWWGRGSWEQKTQMIEAENAMETVEIVPAQRLNPVELLRSLEEEVETLELGNHASRFLLTLAMPQGATAGTYMLRISSQGALIFREELEVEDPTEIHLILSRHRFPAGFYHLEIEKIGDSEESPILFELYLL